MPVNDRLNNILAVYDKPVRQAGIASRPVNLAVLDMKMPYL